MQSNPYEEQLNQFLACVIRHIADKFPTMALMLQFDRMGLNLEDGRRNYGF